MLFFGALFVYAVQDLGLNPQVVLLLGMLIAALAGLLYSLLLSFAAVNMKADQVITGTALNMLIPAAILLFSKMYFNSDGGVTTSMNFYIREVPGLSQIPVLGGPMIFQRTYLTVPISILFFYYICYSIL